MTRPPSVGALVALVAVPALVALLAVGVLTQPTAGAELPQCNRITGLMLDGGTVTTTRPRSSIRPRPERIPRREIGDPLVTTTTVACR